MVILLVRAYLPPISLVDIGAREAALNKTLCANRQLSSTLDRTRSRYLEKRSERDRDEDIPHSALRYNLVLLPHQRLLLHTGERDGRRCRIIGIVTPGDVLVVSDVLRDVGGATDLVDLVRQERGAAIHEAGDVDFHLFIAHGTCDRLVSWSCMRGETCDEAYPGGSQSAPCRRP